VGRGIRARTSLALALVLASVILPAANGAAQQESAVATFQVSGSVEQVSVTGATPETELVLVDRGGDTVGRGRVDALGSLLFRGVEPGAGYRVREPGSGAGSRAVEVRTVDSHPPAPFYESQTIQPGYGYLTTRDGTKLAVNVRLPGPVEDGPYPTVVEYSGYDPANPDGVEPASRLAESLGYATVGVNVRGSGCSGGSWQYFEPLQSLDGYDAVEAIAAQPWVQHGRVGMVGISYPGITQLFVAATQPPHLAAITPLSVIDDTYRGVLYPGGILNTGFAVPWAEDRQSDAEPAPEGGQGWAKRRIAAGDQTCGANQALRLQTPDVLGEIEKDRYYSPERQDHVTPDLFADRIEAPTFLAGAWQDEETGGHWPDLIGRFSAGTVVRATITNGTHTEPFFPSIVTRWAEFLDFYVARRIPSIPPLTRVLAAANYAEIAGTPIELPADRFADETDFDAALARYEAERPVRILFDNGAGGAPGAPIPTFEASFERWPAPGTEPSTWYFGGDGTLLPSEPTRAAVDAYRYDPASVPATSIVDGDDVFNALPDYDWQLPADGTSAVYTTPPLTDDTVLLGPGSADLWIRSSARDVDLQVVLTEVRPDGNETYVQSGWLRASHRALDSSSTQLEPVPTHRRADAAPLPRDEFTLVRVPIFPVGHAFREGSRIRITVQAPGGSRPRWAFDALPADGDVTVEIARTPDRPSQVVLPVVRAIDVTSPLPPCPSLRGQPCREARP
jgi:hypothetical protein